MRACTRFFAFLAAALAVLRASASPAALSSPPSDGSSTCVTNTITFTQAVDESGNPFGGASRTIDSESGTTVQPTSYYPGCSVVSTVTQNVTGTPTITPSPTATLDTEVCSIQTVTFTQPVDASGNPIGAPGCSAVHTVTENFTLFPEVTSTPALVPESSSCERYTITYTRPVDASGSPIGATLSPESTVMPTSFYPGCEVIETVTQDLTVTPTGTPRPTGKPKTKTCQTNTITRTIPVDASGNPVISFSEEPTVTPTSYYPGCSVVITATQTIPFVPPTAIPSQA